MNVNDLYNKILRQLDHEAEITGQALAEAVKRDLRGPGRLFVGPDGSLLRIYPGGSWEHAPGSGESDGARGEISQLLTGEEAKDARGHGSAKRSVYATASHDEPETVRVETPAVRATRIAAKVVDPDRVKVFRKTGLIKETGAVRIRESAAIGRSNIQVPMTRAFLEAARALSRRIKLGLCECERCRRSRVIEKESVR